MADGFSKPIEIEIERRRKYNSSNINHFSYV